MAVSIAVVVARKPHRSHGCLLPGLQGCAWRAVACSVEVVRAEVIAPKPVVPKDQSARDIAMPQLVSHSKSMLHAGALPASLLPLVDDIPCADVAMRTQGEILPVDLSILFAWTPPANIVYGCAARKEATKNWLSSCVHIDCRFLQAKIGGRSTHW